ncbi:hypothetical protein ETB97_006991 [Aspergillus alliaceus]|uniref:Nephrocystin 3-like N-terminal domain-containing protein n=1 Tax=Petromyces alliaceus TaxID=209559 RepID=A0A8H5ZZL3_PETAA|nr:hypothetical protein ETB97_006991 [Aspergillus burnettii]
MGLRQDSLNLRLDQNPKLDAIWSTLREIRSTADNLHDAISASQSSFVGPSRGERSSAAFRDVFNNSQSPLFSVDQVDTLSEGIAKLSCAEQELGHLASEQAVLKSLNFPSRPVRNKNIPLAHKKTFLWTITSPEGMKEDPDEQLRVWLRGGDGIFWVSGKAGSGKSTLMKFLADHNLTRSLLGEWAEQADLVIAAHYFWSIFRKCPGLIPHVCHHRWTQTKLIWEESTEWSTSELRGTLKALSERADLPTRHCFFIDGIDEFDGDHSELCEILSDLSQSPNIKLCLSSRPWNIFVDMFSSDPLRKICMEDLTRNDILRFTESHLTSHPVGISASFHR